MTKHLSIASFIAFLAIMNMTSYMNAQASFQLVKDINPGDNSANVVELTKTGSDFHFFATDGVHGTELWRTDGTDAGTYMIKDIYPGEQGCGSSYWLPSITSLNNEVFFIANDGEHGMELWKTDRTEAGTIMVKNINGSYTDSFYNIQMSSTYMTAMGDHVYFCAFTNTYGTELWKSDGTEAGTVLVTDIMPGTNSSKPQFMTAIGDRIYFGAKSPENLLSIYVTDGTEAGTIHLANAKISESDHEDCKHFVELNGYVYFAASPTSDGDILNKELWRTDGTPQGTGLFMEFNPDQIDDSDPRYLHVINNKLFFGVTNTSNDVYYISDGTTNGTIPLTDINGDEVETAGDFIGTSSVAFGDNVMYIPSTWNGNPVIYKTDGTPTGTIRVGQSPDYMGNYSSVGRRNHAVVIDGKLLFDSYDEENGCNAIFQNDGTSAGIFRTAPCTEYESPTDFENLGNQALVYMVSPLNEFHGELYTVLPDFTSTIGEQKQSESITCYPNPTEGEFVIKTTSNQIKHIQIFDMTGHCVWHNTSFDATTRIDISTFASGLYLVMVLDQQSTTSLRLVKR
ncbi:MAG: T9SS type A sorting domain-containing protein [Flavobacteriales bacterium]|nr:T9SS type A sorting domain-containing protein [Flavobacteriales bacterium]